MAQYLIMFNDEWVPQHTLAQLREKSTTSMKVIEEMKAAGVFVFADGIHSFPTRRSSDHRKSVV